MSFFVQGKVIESARDAEIAVSWQLDQQIPYPILLFCLCKLNTCGDKSILFLLSNIFFGKHSAESIQQKENIEKNN